MALRDLACYTLTIAPSASTPGALELLESLDIASSTPRARYARVKEKRDGEAYSAVVYDAFSGAKLASMGYADVKGKKRRLELHGPDEDVPFEFSGKIAFEWTFIFEGNKYRWTREVMGKDYVCALDRKPDPKVEVCLARDADSKGPGRLQVLHYNIDRFPDEIKDLRGLETLLVASLLCLVDAADDRNGPSRPSLTFPSSSSSSVQPPVVPPAEPPKIITADDFEPENPNEIVVSMTSDIDAHIARAVNLLADPKILFVVIRTRNAAASQRALEVSLGVTRFRHREGMGDLKQYVIEEEPQPEKPITPPKPTGRPGPPVIKLDDPPPNPVQAPSPTLKAPKPQWTPPPNIAIYLSTVELPDLKPGRRESMRAKQKPSPTPSPPLNVPPVPVRPDLSHGPGGSGAGSEGSAGSGVGREYSFAKLLKAHKKR